ncbi:unnamed protein product [Rhizoctonia solani]|uniref:Uncharacterized protein n=1 Tax=Rhizoctonia solani TaxID=456999 RepID=A0A8H3D6E1_9AGAM|nr:unnamed protein product [Rhizoctonia solani]
MKLPAIISFVLFAITPSAIPPCGRHLTQAQAKARLEGAGVYASSSGGCTDKTKPTCTSYDGMLENTTNNVISLKQSCFCSITITGGTEVGHTNGKYSHAKGHSVNIRLDAGLNNYIQTKFKRIGDRSDGSPQWESPAGNIYAKAVNRWDATYPCT